MRDITATLLSDVSKNVKLEQFLLIFNGEELTMEKTAKTNGETRLTSVLGVFGEWPESVP